MTTPDTRADVPAGEALEAFTAVRAEVAKAVVGQDAALSGLLIALLTRGHVLLEGVPGVAKTLLVRALATALDIDTRRVQFTPDLMPGDITGSMVIEGGGHELTFREGPVFTNLLLADEINRTPPKTQSALLEAMEEGQVSTDGRTRPLPTPFVVAATQNPVEYEGTYPLPEAQLDRFLLKVTLPLPARDDELAIVQRHADGFDPRDIAAAGVGKVATPAHIEAAIASVHGVRVSTDVVAYIVDVARATRGAPSLSLGVSPQRRDRAAAFGARMGLAQRTRLRHPRRREGAGARDPGAPAPAASGGRARGRRHRAGARVRHRRGAGSPLGPSMSITWRVPVLVLLGIGPVLLRPRPARCGSGCCWSRCWWRSTWPSPRRARPCPSYAARCVVPARETRPPRPSRSPPGHDGCAACSATRGSRRPARRATGTSSTWPPGPQPCSPATCVPYDAETWPPTA